MKLRLPNPRQKLPSWITRLKPLPVLAGGLALLLLIELLPGNATPPHSISPALPGKSAQLAEANISGWTQTILARPLFNPNRRPTASDDAGGDGLPRLSAIIIGQGITSAIFAIPGQKPLVVEMGGTVNGDKVKSINADSVVLLTANGPIRIRPQFIERTKAPVASAMPAILVSPKTGQPEESTTTAGPYDNE